MPCGVGSLSGRCSLPGFIALHLRGRGLFPTVDRGRGPSHGQGHSRGRGRRGAAGRTARGARRHQADRCRGLRQCMLLCACHPRAVNDYWNVSPTYPTFRWGARLVEKRDTASKHELPAGLPPLASMVQGGIVRVTRRRWVRATGAELRANTWHTSIPIGSRDLRRKNRVRATGPGGLGPGTQLPPMTATGA